MNSNQTLRWSFGAALLLNVVGAWFPFVIDAPRYVHNTAVRAPDGTWTVERLSWVTGNAPELLQSMRERGRLHVSVVAAPQSVTQSGPARIFSIGRNPYDPSLVIGLDYEELVVRFPCGEGARDQDAEWRLPAPQTGLLAVTVDFDASIAAGPSVQIGDASSVHLPNVCPNGAALEIPEAGAPLSVGNDYSGHRPFLGDIRSLTASAGAESLDMLDAVVWQAPASYWLWPERLDEPTNASDQWIPSLWHLLAFVPLGYLAATILGSLNAWSVMGIAGAFAVFLAAGKVLIAGRHPDVIDVLFNTGGAALGFYAGRFIKSSRARDNKP